MKLFTNMNSAFYARDFKYHSPNFQTKKKPTKNFYNYTVVHLTNNVMFLEISKCIKIDTNVMKDHNDLIRSSLQAAKQSSAFLCKP